MIKYLIPLLMSASVYAQTCYTDNLDKTYYLNFKSVTTVKRTTTYNITGYMLSNESTVPVTGSALLKDGVFSVETITTNPILSYAYWDSYANSLTSYNGSETFGSITVYPTFTKIPCP